MNINADNPNKDGWQQVYCAGEIYFEFFDDGEFIIRCTRTFRDEIIKKSGLPLKLINTEIEGILTDFWSLIKLGEMYE